MQDNKRNPESDGMADDNDEEDDGADDDSNYWGENLHCFVTNGYPYCLYIHVHVYYEIYLYPYVSVYT